MQEVVGSIPSGSTRNFPPPRRAAPLIDAEAVARHIRAHLPLTPVPTVSEILIHKAGPRSGLAQLARLCGDGFQTPYWASWWGGGAGLARHLLDEPTLVSGKTVLDLGAGSGLAGIAAARAGAARVFASDTDPAARVAASLNAAANGVALELLPGDLTSGPAPAADLVLVGDVFYEAALARRVTALLDRCLAAGLEVLVGDPGRADLPSPRLQLLAVHEGPDFATGGRPSSLNRVYRFVPERPPAP